MNPVNLQIADVLEEARPFVERKATMALPGLRWVWVMALVGGLAFIGAAVRAEEPEAKKYAFLVGVNKYDKRNFPDLDFAERDMDDLASELTKLGFATTLLRGSKTGDLRATRENIDTQLRFVLRKVTKRDVLLLAFSGHGLQYEVETKAADGTKGKHEDAFYCPVDAVKDEPATLLSLSELIDRRLANQGGKNLVLVDACRDSPKDAGRGVKGVQGRSLLLPDETAVLFSCRAGQESYENVSLQHGLFTHCVLKGLRGAAAGKDGVITWSSLVNQVEEAMSSEELRKLMPRGKEQEPLPAGNVGRTVLARLDLKPVVPKVEPPPLTKTIPVTPSIPDPSAMGMEGKKAGDEREDNGLKMKLCWCPAGRFRMGEGKDAVEVTLTKGFWMGQTNVTQKQWTAVMGTSPWVGGFNIKVGDNYPATCITWNQTIDFCKKFTASEIAAKRLPSLFQYTLPTDAQREYATRANTTTDYSFAGGEDKLDEYGWYHKLTDDETEKYAREVGLKKANGWHFYDLHGNVSEWCLDATNEFAKFSGGTDPLGDKGFQRVTRGGDVFNDARACRSAARYRQNPDSQGGNLGFRVVLVAAGAGK